MIQPPHRVLRGVAGVAGLLGALIGVPVGLLALGQPFPVSAPGWGQVADGLHRPMTDSALLRGAGVLCWLVWAAFAVAVAIEVIGQVGSVGGRLSGRAGVPGLQHAARTLVLAAALLLPQRGMTVAEAAPVPHHRPVVHAVADTEDGEPAVPAPKAHPAAGGPARYVVRHYDSPWGIAERHLGDGARWREIRDIEGRTLVPQWGRGGARVIHPGEVLLLPVEHLPAPAAHTAHPSGNPTAARPGGRPITPAAIGAISPPATGSPAAALDRPPPAARPRTVPTGAPATGSSTAPNRPAAAAPAAPAAAAAPTTTTTPAAAAPPEMLDVTSEHPSAGARPAAAVLLEAGMVGAAVMTLLRALRQRQAQRRPIGRRIRLPGPELAESELAMDRGETTDRVALVASAMELLARTLQQAGARVPTLVGVLVDDAGVEVLLDRPAPAPPPWSASAEGFRWYIAAAAAHLGADAQTPRSAPLPALTSLGRAAVGDADVLINLEAAGSVGIAGPPIRAAAVLHAMATHLSGAPWAGAVDLVLIGLGGALAPLERVRTVPSISAVADELRATTRIMTATMSGHGCTDAFEGRVRGVAGDGWPPTVVLVGAPLTAADQATLLGLARPGSGVVAVIAGGPAEAARWVIDAGASPMPVDPLRLAVQPAALDDASVAAIGQLIEIAYDDRGATLDEAPYDRIDISVDRTDSTAHQPQEVPDLPDPEILIQVLGTVEVRGAEEFKRAKARELLVYLAMHPHGVGEAELDEALWPSDGGRLVVASTRDSTVSAARRAVGGPARLLPAQGQGREKRYQLAPEVQSDWDRFCVLHRWGRDKMSAAALRLALEAVRGRPFEGVASGRTFGWIHTEGHGRHIEAEVGDAADLAAGLYLDAGDAVGARWAARRGLMADPYSERLWVRLMEAADLLGESREVERVMDELDVVLELEGDFSALHPNTLAAYDRLSRRHRFPASR